MTNLAIQTHLAFETVECPRCSAIFAVTTLFEHERRRLHDLFYCPSGHSMSFKSQSTEDALRAQLVREQNRVRFERDQREATERSLAATRGVLTKTRKRIANGICTECNRTFPNLARHMASKHASAEGGKA